MSITGGYYKAVERAASAVCDCVQVFTKNNSQWRAKPIQESDVTSFRKALSDTGVGHPLSHASYLINLASADRALWKKSIDAFVVELQRAESLGIPYVVLHPGAFVNSSEASGIRRITKALNEIHSQTRGCHASCLLETTAGQGSCIGWRFEQLGEILEAVDDAYRLGVCLDTCHMFAAGYDLRDEKSYKQTMRELNRCVGIQRVKAIHLNDSLRGLGSRVDRHAHIGRGKMGLKPFRFLLNDRRFRKIPMYLETAKGEESGVDLDVINLKRLRRLVKKKK